MIFEDLRRVLTSRESAPEFVFPELSEPGVVGVALRAKFFEVFFEMVVERMREAESHTSLCDVFQVIYNGWIGSPTVTVIRRECLLRAQ